MVSDDGRGNVFELPAGSQISRGADGGYHIVAPGLVMGVNGTTFAADDADIDIETETPEFSAWRWAEMAELPNIVVPFKRQIYREVIAEFGHLAEAIREG